MSGRLATWRVALRIARRDALRAKGRSALVVAMIALPILGVTAADLALRSGDLSRSEELTRDFGRADARYQVETNGSPVQQSPTGNELHYLDESSWEETPDRTAEEVAAELGGMLPAGTEILTDRSTHGVVHSRTGLLTTEIRELDAASPLTEGMLTLLRGHFPEGPDEVAATQAFLDESGLYVGSELRVKDDDRTYRITGAYELPGELNNQQIVALPGAVLPLPESASGGDGWLDTRVSALVGVPDGPVTWDMVMAANERGLSVDSRAVILDPPPDSEVPLYQDGMSMGDYSSEADPMVVAGAVTAVSLIILEICLLAGPAFAVGARRSRRQLGLVGSNGGDRRHLRAIMLASGVVLGAVAAVIGVVGGLVLTLLAHPLIENQSGSRFGPWDFRVLELVGIAVLAVLVGLCAALVPAFSAARSSVLDSLTGRRGVRRSGRVLPVIGVCALVLGAALAIVGGLTMNSSVVVAAGSIMAELGLVALTPLLVGVFGRLARWLPLAGRLALRDAARNRGRTAPAVAAVLAAVAGTVAVATALASDDAEHRADYRPMLPEGTVSIGSWDFAENQLDRAGAIAEDSLPVDVRADAYRIRVGAEGCDPYDFDPANACGLAEAVVPPERLCPLWQPEAESLTVAERRELNDDPRCAEGDQGWAIEGSALTVAGPELLTVLGVDPAQAEEAARALERGEAVAFNDRTVDDEGRITVQVYETQPENWNEDGSPAEEPDAVATFTAHRVDAKGYGFPPIISPTAAEAQGLDTELAEIYYSTTRVPTGAEEQAFDAMLAEELGTPPSTYIEDGYESEAAMGLLILGLAAMVITLGAAGIATGLAQADSEADLATLAAVGAAPRVRRTLSGLQCGLIAAMGVLLGAVSGLIPAMGLRLAEHRSEVASWEDSVDQGWGSGPRPELFIELPWATFAQLIVVVPLVACLLAALLTRSRMHLARRAG
ncbi:ABC transporter permease [Streptomyces litchfieldiae]|uniref:ABC transporter permease n=1 Tax=Streptomyces litchfieldiae TaxID=3075543 RepID=A0ABU2MKV9_9ACTN|nr:ABC transporter permease [Streptomyces sp. DSM 44938]MDT0342247.1 ABC transporter permease [Streptomyces sp. DSM 44938]